MSGEAKDLASKLARVPDGPLDEEPLVGRRGDALVVGEAHVKEESAGLAADAEAQRNGLGASGTSSSPRRRKSSRSKPAGTRRASLSSSAVRMRASASWMGG